MISLLRIGVSLLAQLVFQGVQFTQLVPPFLLDGTEFEAEQLVGFVAFLLEDEIGSLAEIGCRQFCLLAYLLQQGLFFRLRAIKPGKHVAEFGIRVRIFLFLRSDPLYFDADLFFIGQENEVTQRQRPFGNSEVHGRNELGFDIVHIDDLVHLVFYACHAFDAEHCDYGEQRSNQPESDSQPRGDLDV